LKMTSAKTSLEANDQRKIGYGKGRKQGGKLGEGRDGHKNKKAAMPNFR